MLTRFLDKLPRPRFSHRLFAGVAALTVALYFASDVINVPRGYMDLLQSRKAVAKAKRELAMLQAERDALAHKVGLLSGPAIDPDLLEEEARRVLSFAHPDDVIVLMPPIQSIIGKDDLPARR